MRLPITQEGKRWLSLIERKANEILNKIENETDEREIIFNEIRVNAIANILYDLLNDDYFSDSQISLEGARIRDELIKKVDSLVSRRLTEIKNF